MHRRVALPVFRMVLAAPVSMLLASCIVCHVATAQTTLNANTLALHSNGEASGNDWKLLENGYVGTYITLAAPGDVTIGVQASGQGSGGPAPHMNIVVGDRQAEFEVAPGFGSYQHTFSLPAGTHFIRTEFTNDFVGEAIPASSRSLTVRDLSVTGAGVSNLNNDDNALAAADTYIENGRRGPLRVALVGAKSGSQVDVRLARHTFNWGANMHGTSTALLSNSQYTNFFKSHFNMVVPSRGGKWNNNESRRDIVTSVTNGYIDAMLDFAEANGLRVRLHNLIWANSPGAEQPSWVLDMLNNPSAVDVATGKTNLEALREEISERIGYYVGDGPGGFSELSQRYQEVDIYNESWHTGVNTPGDEANYWDRYHAAGIANIYEEAAQAAANAGSNARMYVNEYNVFNWGDPYANWYRQHIEEIQNADGDPANGPVEGVGIQAYLGSGGGGLQPARVQQAMQTLSVLDLPQSLTEFGVSDSVAAPVAKDYVNQLMRMVFGHPDMNTFMYWGFWGGATSQSAQGASILANADWSLTDIGRMYEDMLGIHDWDGDPTNGWTTNQTLEVGPDGTIEFNGFYGDYEITIDGETYDLLLEKGAALQSIVVAPGDYNANGIVDAADYVVWRKAAAVSGNLRADGNGDELVDAGDLEIWRSLFGSTIASNGGAAAVPEPASFTLILLFMSAAPPARRRRLPD